MLKRPSSRRKSHKTTVEINLVPILDTMVTLIGFLLFTTSFLKIVSLETVFPQASPEEIEKKREEKPLQLTLSLEEAGVKIWSPFEKIPEKIIPYQEKGLPDLKRIHETLLEVKKSFPLEKTMVLMPMKTIPYDMLLSIMDSARLFENTDTPVYFKNRSTGVDERIKILFPEIVFGNLLEPNL